MSRKVRIGFTHDYLDKEGNFLLPGDSLKLLHEMPNVEYEMFPEIVPEATPELIQDFDIIITRTFTRWTEKSFAGNNRLLSIHRNGVGYDRIDVPALSDASVMLCITPDAVRRPVAVAILTFILALSTRLMLKDRMTRDGQWGEVTKQHGTGLIGRTLGSIGVGNIGHELFMLAKPLGMKHIAYDPYIQPGAVADVGVELVDMETVLAESDFVNVSCPLNQSTRYLIGEKELRRMKPTAYLINTARGPIIDEAALNRALREGWIQGAALDVFEQEPTPPDNPLFKLDNAIVTAHAMAFTDQFLASVWEIIFKQILQIVQGQIPDGVVNREVWDKPEFQAKLWQFHEAIR
jgi:phosphoglycerate dehydrogenase-like enzyme